MGQVEIGRETQWFATMKMLEQLRLPLDTSKCLVARLRQSFRSLTLCGMRAFCAAARRVIVLQMSEEKKESTIRPLLV